MVQGSYSFRALYEPQGRKGQKQQKGKKSQFKRQNRDWRKQKAVEAKIKNQISKLISEAEAYLKEHLTKILQCSFRKADTVKSEQKKTIKARLVGVEKEHQGFHFAKLSDPQ